MNPLPKTVKATLILINLNAIFWFGYAVVSALGAVDSNTGILAAQWLMAGLAFISGAALSGIAFFLRRRSRFAYYFGLFMLALIAVLSVTDQVGWLDIFSLLISIIPLALMLKDQGWYLRSQQSPEG